MPTPDPRYEWLSTREASIREGVSTSTIGRMIREGKLIAESVERPGGTLLRVRYPRTEDAPEDAPTPLYSVSIDPPPAPEPRQDAPAATTALVTALAVERAERQSLAAENADLRERVGRAETRADAERQRAADLAASLERERARADQAEQRLADRRWWNPATW